MPACITHAPGTFCSVELASPAAAVSARFYTALFGWTGRDRDLGEAGVHTQFLRDGARVAAQFGPTTEASPWDRTPQWGLYVSVADIKASISRARGLGATVLRGPLDVLDDGRMAMLEDPQGVAFNLWQPLGTAGVEVLDEPGAWCWSELMSRHPDAATEFYAGMFGWGTEPMDLGALGVYTIWSRGEERPAGGMMGITPGMRAGPDGWLIYFQVADPDATHARAVGLGAVSLLAPMDIPSAGRTAVLQDPVGARFGIYRSSR